MEKISSGKVRDIYEVDKDTLMLVVSDRISAFDFIMPNLVEDKGIILTQISEFWFNYVNDIVKNHIVTTKFEEFPEFFQTEEFKNRSMLVKKLKMLPIECIVRGYLSGSGWNDYKKTGSIGGIYLPDNLKESEKLETPIFTPSTKAELGGHDENISFEDCVDLIGYDLAEQLKNTTIDIYNKCAKYASEQGIIIADTKLEFGLDSDNNLVLADEVLTPDSSRFWDASTYEVGKSQQSYDKQFLRDWLIENGYKTCPPDCLPDDVLETTRNKYIEAYETLTKEEFVKVKKR